MNKLYPFLLMLFSVILILTVPSKQQLDLRLIMYCEVCECGYENMEVCLSYVDNTLQKLCSECGYFEERAATYTDKYKINNSIRVK